jgi:hypothetical protein
VSQDSAALNASIASDHFIQYADLSRCFFITPAQVGNASIGSKSKKHCRDDFKVTFSPRPSGNGGPQCTFNLELPHRDDVLAMHTMFSSLMQYYESVVTGGAFDPQLHPVAKGKHYQFSTTAYARPGNPTEGSLPTVLVYHFNIALLINGRPHHVGTVTLNGAINTVYNLRDDLDVLKALFQREPIEAIRKIARPSAIWI